MSAELLADVEAPEPASPAGGSGVAWDLVAAGAVLGYTLNVIAVKVALRHVPVGLFTTTRFLTAGALLVALSAARRRRRVSATVAGGTATRRIDRKRLIAAALMGIVVNQLAFSLSVEHTTAVDVALIVGATPLVVVVWQTLTRAELPLPGTWLALLLGAIGITVVILGGSHGNGSSHLSGDLLAVAALLSWSGYIVILGPLVAQGDAAWLTGLVSLIGATVLIPLAVVDLVNDRIAITSEVIGLFAFSTLIATATATVAYYAALRRLGPSRLASFQYLQPFAGAVAAWLLLGERIGALQFAGGAIVILALWRMPRRLIGSR
jgi:drug/metabolite transporter (DMT)-like permease